jgi:hypothetical protein
MLTFVGNVARLTTGPGHSPEEAVHFKLSFTPPRSANKARVCECGRPGMRRIDGDSGDTEFGGPMSGFRRTSAHVASRTSAAFAHLVSVQLEKDTEGRGPDRSHQDPARRRGQGPPSLSKSCCLFA